jgi:hypothetical protein
MPVSLTKGVSVNVHPVRQNNTQRFRAHFPPSFIQSTTFCLNPQSQRAFPNKPNNPGHDSRNRDPDPQVDNKPNKATVSLVLSPIADIPDANATKCNLMQHARGSPNCARPS